MKQLDLCGITPVDTSPASMNELCKENAIRGRSFTITLDGEITEKEIKAMFTCWAKEASAREGAPHYIVEVDTIGANLVRARLRT